MIIIIWDTFSDYKSLKFYLSSSQIVSPHDLQRPIVKSYWGLVANREGKALQCAPKGKFSFSNGVDDNVDDNDNDYKAKSNGIDDDGGKGNDEGGGKSNGNDDDGGKGNGSDDVVTAPPRVSQLAAVWRGGASALRGDRSLFLCPADHSSDHYDGNRCKNDDH